MPEPNLMPESDIDQSVSQLNSTNGQIEIKNDLTYQISTCNTELTIFVEPTKENINSILQVLIIEDLVLKN